MNPLSKQGFPPPQRTLWTMQPWSNFLREIWCLVPPLRGSALRLEETLCLQWQDPFPGKEGPSSKPFSPGFHGNVLTTSCEQLQPHLLEEVAELSTPTQYNNTRAVMADSHFLSFPQRTKVGKEKKKFSVSSFALLTYFHFNDVSLSSKRKKAAFD